MFGITTNASRGIGMIVLQALRVLTIIGLTAACASCWVMMVKVRTGHTYFVFEAASLFFLGIICLFLVASEAPVVSCIRNFYRTSWPNFSDAHGMTWLGVSMILIGCNLLGQLNSPAYSADNFGLAFWQLVMASGILCLTFGVLNVACSFVWRDAKNGITARDVRSNGSIADSSQKLPDYYSHDSRSPAESLRNEKTRSKFMSTFWKRGQQDDNETVVETSPIVPGIRKPDITHHPGFHRPTSVYSEANMSRF